MKRRCKAVYPDEDRQSSVYHSPFDQFFDRLMVRRMQGMTASVALCLRQAQVSRDQDAVSDRRNNGEIAWPTVQIDDETRVVRQHGIGGEALPKPARHTGRPDIPGDMVGQILVVDAEMTENLRKTVARVITDKNDAAVAAAFDQLEWSGLIRTNEFGCSQGETF